MSTDTPPAEAGLHFPPAPSSLSRSARESFWRNTLAAFAASGQSVSEFCRAHGLTQPTFYSWRKKIRCRDQEEAGQASGPAFLPVVVRGKPAGAVEQGLASDQGLAIELRGGRLLRLPVSMPMTRLVEVVHALEGLA